MVSIKEELRRALIFGLKARPPIGIILGFMAYRHEVIPMMQTLCHATRAYITNADGLPGFVVEFDIINCLQTADKVGHLEHAKRWQVIDLRTIEQ